MTKKRSGLLLAHDLARGLGALLVLSTLAGCGPKAAPPLPADQDRVFLFSYFKDGERRDGRKIAGGAGLYLAWSADGLEFHPVGQGHVWQPRLSPMMRDPFLARGPDGVFHLVWTTGWNEKTIGHAASDDLIHWRDEAMIPVMANEPTTRNTWAPEIFYDDASGRYLIFWSSTIPGRFPATQGQGDDNYDHRIYYTTTADWKTFAPAKLLIDPGRSCIDADVFKWRDGYAMILKIETLKPPAKWLVVSRADSPEGPWGPVSEPITTPGDWSEGPSAIVIDGQAWVYFDRYVAHKYAAVTSADLKTWTYVEGLKMPRGVRHGNVVAVETPLVEGLIEEMAGR